MLPWFERPVIYDVRARPNVITSTSGSRDLQMVSLSRWFFSCAMTGVARAALLQTNFCQPRTAHFSTHPDRLSSGGSLFAGSAGRTDLEASCTASCCCSSAPHAMQHSITQMTACMPCLSLYSSAPWQIFCLPCFHLQGSVCPAWATPWLAAQSHADYGMQGLPELASLPLMHCSGSGKHAWSRHNLKLCRLIAGQHQPACADASHSWRAAIDIQNSGHRLCRARVALHHPGDHAVHCMLRSSVVLRQALACSAAA